MGVTVTTGKAVMAFQSKNEVIYVLNEETYEKNCTPHTPHRCCFAIGNYKEVMSRVYGRASAAAGGGLNNRAGNLTPETFLRGWNLAFHKPMMLNNRDISFKILERDRWRDGIESDRAGLVYDVLKATNRLDVWEKLISEDDTVTLSLYDDIDLIVSLFGVNGVDQPWKIIDEYTHIGGKEHLGFIPQKWNGGKYPATMDRLAMLKYKYGEKFVEMQSDGSFANPRSKWSVIGDYVRTQAYQCEMIEQGLGVKHIQAFREVLSNEPDCSMDFDAFIDKSSVEPDMVRQFEYNMGISFADAKEVHQLPSIQFALENVSSLLKVYFKRRHSKGAVNDLLMAA